MRKAGILLPVSALPSPYGVGDFGKTAHEAIDIMAAMGLKIWQILPLNPLGFGHSPYQPYSSKAIDEIYVDLDALQEQGLIKTTDDCEFDNAKVYYEEARIYKRQKLSEAFQNYQKDDEYDVFSKKDWVQQYALFISLKIRNQLCPWQMWPQKTALLEKTLVIDDELKASIDFEIFIQYILFKQLKSLLDYAHAKDILVMGDIPFYVGLDSADVLFNPDNFLLDSEYCPTHVAGVPPDYFSATGQRWGNPIYDWDYLAKNNFAFWLDRLKFTSDLYDIIRIDHFRAFDTYWKIPSDCPTAIKGEWVEAPGYAFFDTLFKQYPEMKIIAEDLGELRPEVLTLRDHYGFKGMKVIQFTFNPHGEDYMADRENLVIYTGTHDNQTIKGWYQGFDAEDKKLIRKKLRKQGYIEHNINDCFVRMALDSLAELAIVTAQDIIGMDDRDRINVPGTIGSPNWEFRLKDYQALKRNINKINLWIKTTKR